MEPPLRVAMPKTARNAVVLITALVLPAAFSGCLSVEAAKDWWNDQAIVVVKVGTLPATAPGQRLGDLSEVKIGLRNIQVYPVGELVAHAGVNFGQPFGVDLRKRFDDGAAIPVMTQKVQVKTIERIGVQIFVVQVKDTAGNAIPGCDYEKKDQPRPCLAIPRGGNYELDLEARPTILKRGGTTAFTVPLVVGYDPKVDEYFIQARSHETEAPITTS